MRCEAERSGVFLQEPIEVGGRSVGGLCAEDFPQYGGSRTHRGDIVGGERDVACLAVRAEHIGDFARVGELGIENVDQGCGPPSHGQYGVPGGPVVDVGRHLGNVTHLVRF